MMMNLGSDYIVCSQNKNYLYETKAQQRAYVTDFTC